jgi:hypothetical protein
MSLAGNTALKLRSDFLPRPLFERVGASGDDQSEPDRDQRRQGLHPLILGMKPCFARG